MKLRNLGNSSLKVSEIALGSWLSIGGENKDTNTPGSPSIEERETGLKILRKAVDQGITFFDTAPGYGKGNAERMIGEFMQDYDRDEFIISTKLFFPIKWNDNMLGTGNKSIHLSIRDSLERLQTDYIDVYYCHVYDNMGKIEETIRGMNRLLDQGKILYWAASNWTAAEIERVYGICKAEGMVPPIVLQDKYNLLNRDIEVSHLSTFDYTKIGLVAYSPLHEGILTGKYNHEIPSNNRFTKVKGTEFEEYYSNHLESILTEETLQKLRNLEELAKEQEITMSQLSLAWLLSKRFVSSVIAGASKEEHVETNAETSRLELEKDVFKRIEEIMDNEPEIPKEHRQWNYVWIKKSLEKSNNRFPSVAYHRKQAEKEKKE